MSSAQDIDLFQEIGRCLISDIVESDISHDEKKNILQELAMECADAIANDIKE